MPLLLANITTGTGDAALTSDERNYIREILGVSMLDTDLKYKFTENRFNLFIPYQNKSARYWMLKYEEYSEDEDTIEINAEGADISDVRTRQRVSLALYNLVFSSNNVVPIDDINVWKYEEPKNKATFVKANYYDDDIQRSEY